MYPVMNTSVLPCSSLHLNRDREEHLEHFSGPENVPCDEY